MLGKEGGKQAEGRAKLLTINMGGVTPDERKVIQGKKLVIPCDARKRGG